MRLSIRPLVVIDTNVFLSAYVWGGIPKQVIKLWQNGRFNLLYSTEALFELVSLLAVFKFDPDRIKKIKQEIEERAKKIIPSEKVTLCRDPKDNQFLELCLAASADYLITGDKDLLVLKKFQQTQIFSPKQFLGKFK